MKAFLAGNGWPPTPPAVTEVPPPRDLGGRQPPRRLLRQEAAAPAPALQPVAASAPAPAQEPAAAATPRLKSVKVAILKEASDWQPPAVMPKVFRDLPFKNFPGNDADLGQDFSMWLDTVMVLDTESTKPCIQALQRFLSCLEITSGHSRTSPEVLAALYKQSLMPKLMSLNLLDPNHSWSQKMPSALGKWCKWHIEQCQAKASAFQDEGETEAARDIAALKENIDALSRKLTGWTKRSSRSHKRACRDRLRYDAGRMDNMADDDSRRAAVLKAMLELRDICEKYKDERVLPKKQHGRANVAMAGIIFQTGFAGRDHEWKEVEAQYVIDQLEAGHEFLVIGDHKTASTYGDVVKQLFPGVAEAMKWFLKLPRDPDNPKFFQPVQSTSRGVSMQGLLDTFGRRYLPGWQPPAVNLIRKQLNLCIAMYSNMDDMLNMLVVVDKHSKNTIKSSYVAMTFEKEAKYCAACFIRVFGEPVPWPSNELADELRAADAKDKGGGSDKVKEEDDGTTSEEEDYGDEAVEEHPIALPPKDATESEDPEALGLEIFGEAGLEKATAGLKKRSGPEEPKGVKDKPPKKQKTDSRGQRTRKTEQQEEEEEEQAEAAPRTERASVFSPEQKAWMKDWQATWCGGAALITLPNPALRDMIAEAQKTVPPILPPILPPNVLEKVRHVLRFYKLPEKDAAKSKVEEGLPAVRKAAARIKFADKVKRRRLEAVHCA